MAQKPLAKKRARGTSTKLPAVENRHHTEHGHAVTYELRPVLCGKPKCSKLHGPYWYAYWTQGGRVRTVYIGKKFQRVEKKCPERFAPGGL